MKVMIILLVCALFLQSARAVEDLNRVDRIQIRAKRYGCCGCCGCCGGWGGGWGGGGWGGGWRPGWGGGWGGGGRPGWGGGWRRPWGR
ncbi:unnamed protein product [Anisakis simplex]|uniref:Uncharacterized protein n=1 Tax=Anisakis simplex TaxID=6269 RepID=A0A0M3JRP5_ANISI|nr:unnamed protein product [Anisakis simplex]